MIIEVKKFTSVINKVSDLTAGDKIVPGLMLCLSKDDSSESDNGTLKVCYSDGHKSLIEEIEVQVEEKDYIGDIIVSFEQMKRAVGNCQPSGIINTNGGIKISYLDNKIIRVSADQFIQLYDNDGNPTENRKIAIKKMDLTWTEPGSDIKSSILTRMKYDTIFEPDGGMDEYDKAELIDALSKTSVEKGKNIYISANVQSVFVANQAHVTAVPVSGVKLTQEDIDEISGTLSENGTFSEENLKAEIEKRSKRINQSIVMTQTIAKALIGIFGKCDSDKVFIHRRDKFCNIIIENDTEKVGVWFEMSQASKAHIGAFERYNSYGYKSYQIMFLREFLANNVKSALESAKSDKVALKFEPTELDVPTCDKDLVITCGNSSASIADSYRVNPDDLIDVTGDIESKTFVISLQVLNDMLAQLKTSYVAFDINVDSNDVVCLRLAEVDDDKLADEYKKARQEVEKQCIEKNEQFVPDKTPTPIEMKLDYRVNTLNTKQFTMLAK